MTENLSPRARALVDFVAERIDTQQTPEFTRLNERLLNVQVCTSLSDEDATERMNLVPSGTTYGWQLTEDPDLAPVPCADNPTTHRHLIFAC